MADLGFYGSERDSVRGKEIKSNLQDAGGVEVSFLEMRSTSEEAGWGDIGNSMQGSGELSE